jgi:hypothetical protein
MLQYLPQVLRTVVNCRIYSSIVYPSACFSSLHKGNNALNSLMAYIVCHNNTYTLECGADGVAAQPVIRAQGWTVMFSTSHGTPKCNLHYRQCQHHLHLDPNWKTVTNTHILQLNITPYLATNSFHILQELHIHVLVTEQELEGHLAPTPSCHSTAHTQRTKFGGCITITPLVHWDQPWCVCVFILVPYPIVWDTCRSMEWNGDGWMDGWVCVCACVCARTCVRVCVCTTMFLTTATCFVQKLAIMMPQNTIHS